MLFEEEFLSDPDHLYLSVPSIDFDNLDLDTDEDLTYYVLSRLSDQDNVLPSQGDLSPRDVKLPRIVLRDYFGHELDTDTSFQVCGVNICKNDDSN